MAYRKFKQAKGSFISYRGFPGYVAAELGKGDRKYLLIEGAGIRGGYLGSA